MLGRERAKAGRARHVPGSSWRPALVLMLVALVDRIETGIVPGVLPLLQDQWGFSDTAGGAIPTAVTIAGLIVTLPAGYFADRTNRKNLIAGMVGSWSLIITGSALAPGFGIFFATRVALGMADSVDTPSALSLMGDFYEPKRRSRAYGYQRMCYLIGSPIGIVVGGIVGQVYGWRTAFFSMVIPGLVVAFLVWRLPEPVRGAIDRRVARQGAGDQSEAAPPAELAVAGTGIRELMKDIGSLIRVRTIAFIYFGLMCLFAGISGIFFWLPTYYERVFDMGTGLGGALTAVVAIVGVIGGTVLGGALGDRLHGRVAGARVVIGGVGLFAGCFLFVGAFALGALGPHVVALTIAVVVMGTASPNLTAAIADVIPAAQRGIGFALVTFLMSIGSAFGPLGVGFASDQFGSLRAAFYVLVVPMLIGSIVVLFGRKTFDADAERVLEMARRSL